MTPIPFALAFEGRKTCSLCLTTKFTSEFYTDLRKRDGLRPRCKKCFRISLRPPVPPTPQQRAKYRRNAASRAGRSLREYMPSEEVKRQANERRAAREAERIAKALRPAPVPLPPIGSKAWYSTASAAEIDDYRASRRAIYAARYKRIAAAERLRAQEYKAARPHVREQWNGRRSDRINQQSDGSLTRDVVRALFGRATQCPYCDCSLAPGGKALDHVVPLALGGLHGIGNVVIACRPCNSKKSAKPLDRWLAEIGRPALALPAALAA